MKADNQPNMKNEDSLYLNFMIDMKIMLDNMDELKISKGYRQKIKFHGNLLERELEGIFNNWLKEMGPDMEKIYFYSCKIRKQFNDIMKENSANPEKMAILKTILQEFKAGNIMQADDECVNMIKSVKPDSIKRV